MSLPAISLVGCSGLLGIDEAVPRADAPPAIEPCQAAGAQCVGEDVLRTCAAAGELPVDQSCGWGCSSVAGAARCAQLVPVGGVLRSNDLLPNPALGSRTITGLVQLSTDDGSISGVRAAVEGVDNGIGFEIRGTVAVFSFRSVVLDGVISVTGGRALAVVADGGVTINGVLDLRGDCAVNAPGPGGRVGGAAQTAGVGLGGGGAGVSSGNTTSGGGGGGWGGIGGRGGDGGAVLGGAAGSSHALLAMMGGGGGGGGGSSVSGSTGGYGGGGGGAVQILSNSAVTFGMGAAPGGINAGGCGGKSGANLSSGGGGGAGGTILIEAPTIRLAAAGRVAANGGGGGAARNGGDGQPGALGSAAAPGGVLSGNVGSGGRGGATGSIPGQAGEAAPQNGGGAGGAAGIIRLHTRRGAITVDAGGLVSPSLEEPGSTASQGAATVQ